MQAESSSLRATAAEQSGVIQRLQCGIKDSEQYSCRVNLDARGLAVMHTENLNESLKGLALKLNLLTPQLGEILAVHRLPLRENVVPAVLMRFSFSGLGDKWLNAHSRLRALREVGSETKVFFNENLTRANKELFWRR